MRFACSEHMRSLANWQPLPFTPVTIPSWKSQPNLSPQNSSAYAYWDQKRCSHLLLAYLNKMSLSKGIHSPVHSCTHISTHFHPFSVSLFVFYLPASVQGPGKQLSWNYHANWPSCFVQETRDRSFRFRKVSGRMRNFSTYLSSNLGDRGKVACSRAAATLWRRRNNLSNTIIIKTQQF